MEKKTKATTKTKTEVEQKKHGIVENKEVDPKTRTILLLDSRNDLVPYFFSGLDAMAANYKTKAVNQFVDFVYMTCTGFIETVRDKSLEFMKAKNPEYGIGDILRNRKGQMRMIVNMFIEPKTKELNYSWIDPQSAQTPMSACSAKTMSGWIEK